MSEEDQKSVEIKAYVPFFRKFHFILGASIFLGFVSLKYIFDKTVATVFLVVFPFMAYTYFFVKTQKYYGSKNNGWNKVAVLLTVGTFAFAIFLIGGGLRENKLIFSPSAIEISGSYGETVKESDIKSIGLVATLPEIKMRTNGLAIGNVRKGYFKTKDREIVKLILNSSSKARHPYYKNRRSKDILRC